MPRVRPIRRTAVVSFLALIASLIAGLQLTARAEGTPCEWLSGDFHVHTVYSHDSWGGPESDDDNTNPFVHLPSRPDKAIEDAITLGLSPGEQGQIAESRGLDFIAITDHDDIRAQNGDEWFKNDPLFPKYGEDSLPNPPSGHDLIWVPNYENSVLGTGNAHAQMHGATAAHFAEYEAPDVVGPAVTAELLHDRDDGAFQINHPADMRWHDDAGNYEYPGFAPDALEVWNIGAWPYQPPAPATNDHEFVIDMWNDLLDQGFHVAGTGGSDNHWRSTVSLQGVGQPTTWVCAEARTSDAIIEGVLANRTSVSNQPPAYGGPRAYLFADDPLKAGTFESMVGDTVTPGSPIEVRVDDAEGATLHVLTDRGLVLAEETIDSPDYSLTIEDVPGDSTWVRVEIFYPDGRESRRQLQPYCDRLEDLYEELSDEPNTYCENRLAVIAITSPIYFESPEFDPATLLTYEGTTDVKVGDSATFAATLLDSTGAPLANQTITFTFRGETYATTTDDSGLGSVTVRAHGPPGSYEVVTDFAGTDTYAGSQDRDYISVTTGAGLGRLM
ncbi:MAG: CehA/McbA family metallohydrolase [Actinomycetota bacterium]|nr:CehA/McbA family metallohydrolase [Actinomycetota bacterium]